MKQFIYLSLVFTTVVFGQTPEISTELRANVRPLPSAASLINFAEVPANEFTGVPSISIPLYGYQTHSNNVSVDVSLGYHPKSASFNDRSSDVGTGWSLNAGGSISRVVNHKPDEDYYDSSFTDDYFYNFFGRTGSFKVLRDASDNPEKIVYMSNADNIKIEFVKNANSNTIDSFKIYDTQGIQYLFQVYDVNVTTFPSFTPSGSGLDKSPIFMEYISSYHLNKVLDTNNKELVSIAYQNLTRPEPFTQGNLKYFQIKKLSTITVVDFGSIDFSFEYNNYMDDRNSEYLCDSFRLKDVIYKDVFGNQIKKYTFGQSYTEFNFKLPMSYGTDMLFANIDKRYFRRYLHEIKEYDRLNQSFRRTQLNYNLDFNSSIDNLYLDGFGYINLLNKCVVKTALPPTASYTFQNGTSNKNSVSIGVLKSIVNPAGGSTEFEFESNTYSKHLYSTNPFYAITDAVFANYNDDNKQVDLLYTLNYNTNISKIINFSVTNAPNGKKFYFQFENQPLSIPSGFEPPDGEPYEEVNYVLDVTSGTVNNNFEVPRNFSDHYTAGQFELAEDCNGKGIFLRNGNYNLTLSTYINRPATGTVRVYEENFKPVLKKWLYGGGVRIKNIKYYDRPLNTIPANYTPKTVSFDYNSFTDSSKTSGEFMYGGVPNAPSSDLIPSNIYEIGYKNVTRKTNDGEGYTKSTFLMSSEVSNTTTGGNTFSFFQNYNAVKEGLLSKSEVFRNDNKLLQSTENTYEFVEIDPTTYVATIENFGTNGIYSRIAWAKLTAKNSKSYFYPNGSSIAKIKQINETFDYNPVNKLISESTTNSSEGETLKTKYLYHTGNSIYSQNRIGEIETIESYKGTELLTKSKIIYSNSWQNNVSLLPQTIVTAKGTNVFEDRVQYIQYDTFGNPLEAKQEGGMSITYIWGYNQTQPIAKIENATYAQIQSYLANLQTASNGANEGAFITALNTFRTTLKTALPNAMITTYTYKPLVGISTVTDPHENVTTYHYDTYNRLEFVKDKAGNILNKNEYHYKN